jgi:amidophosphoribosyltransferase
MMVPEENDDLDHPHEECGVIGVFATSDDIDVAQTTFYGLYALQHRGQEGAGIAVYDENTGHIKTHRGVSLVSRVFDEAALASLTGHVSIGHVRYATYGSSTAENVQPFVVRFSLGELAVAHNGNLVNAKELTAQLESTGSIFQSGLDTEVFAHLISRSGASTFEAALALALPQVQGAYSLTMLFNDALYAVRDPNGFRPLVLGQLRGSTIVASETCALDLIGADFLREVLPGEIVRIDKKGVTSTFLPTPDRPTPCVFELVYFARPDSMVFGQNAYAARFRMGEELARESPTEADVVMPVPDSGIAAALGYSQASGVPYGMGLTRNHYIGRTFIQPGQDTRELKLKVKLNTIRSNLAGRRIVLVDDSIVRGTTMKLLVQMIRAAGPKEIHLRISSPPIKHPCHFGIDTPYYKDLVAATKSLEEITEYLGVDSLRYLSIEGLRRSVGPEKSFCRACFDGNYPIRVPQRISTNTTEMDRVTETGAMRRPSHMSAPAPKEA